MEAVSNGRDLSLTAYRSLAELRHQIRRFIRYSEDEARVHGIEPQQHQLLLAIKGLPPGKSPTIREIAGRLLIRHHSAVELINRLSERGAIVREPAAADRREVLVKLTPAGEQMLHSLTVEHQTELTNTGPQLMRALSTVLKLSEAELSQPAKE